MKSETKFKETEIGRIPEDWNVKEIGDVCHLVRSSFLPSKEESRDYIGLEHIEQDTLRLISIGSSKNINSNKLIFKKGQVLFGKLRPYFRKVYRPNFEGVCSTDIFVIDANKEIDNCFLFYFFADRRMIEEATLSSEGTRMPRASWKYLESLQRGFPDMLEQKAIAKVLADLDSKIELNIQMNKTLEAIAQAIFKHWFVDFEFPTDGRYSLDSSLSKGRPYKSSGGEMVDSELGEIPKGWRIGRFSDLVDNVKQPLKPGVHLKARKYVPIDCLPKRRIALDNYRNFSEAKSSLIALEKNDILFGAMRAYFHRVALAPFSGITRTTTFVLRPRDTKCLGYVLFLLNQDSSVDYANSRSKGTTMPCAVWDNSLADMPVVLPEDAVMYKYSFAVRPSLDRSNSAIWNIQSLAQIRDALLPRFMSGRIRVVRDSKVGSHE